MTENKPKNISYSQFSMFSSCQMQYKLQYIDKIGEYNSNIHLVFGTAMHETIQNFLEIMYSETKKAALEIDFDSLLMSNLKKVFLDEQEKMGGKEPCTLAELTEFYKDGCEILYFLKKKLTKFFPKGGYSLVGTEIRLNNKIRDGIHFIGFIDIVIKDNVSGKYIIIDLKTSTNGWSKYQKADKTKTSQMLLYKKYYSELLDIPLDSIDVEYHILKRKIKESEFPIPRISKFVPANGKPSINKVMGEFISFVDHVYDENGNVKDIPFIANVGKGCDWCDFKTKGCPEWSYLQKNK